MKLNLLLVGALVVGFAAQAQEVAPEAEETVVTVEQVACESVGVYQWMPIEGEPHEPYLSRSVTTATRTIEKQGNLLNAMTEGKTVTLPVDKDREGTETTYISTRETEIVELGGGLIREVSDIRTESTYPVGEGETQTRVDEYRMVSEYELQMDGAKKYVRQFKDGVEMPMNYTDFRMITEDGTEYAATYSEEPTIYPSAYGDSKTLLVKQICTIKQQK